MKLRIITSIIFGAILFSQSAKASWMSDITGIHVNLNKGTLSITPPNISAIPSMIQNLPKDMGQALINPAAPVLATAIRFSREQALNRGVQPIPPEIHKDLSPYFPQEILSKVRWTTANGISIDGALKNWLALEGAITYDDVIVFSEIEGVNDRALWAHELTHVLQYSQMGVETFAFQYTYDWNALENQARSNAEQIMISINNTLQGQTQSWAYQGQPAAPTQQLTWDVMNKLSRIAIPAQQCIWINHQMNITGNNCPVNIMVSEIILRRIHDGYTFRFPCNEPTCLFQAGQQGPLLSPAGHLVVGVTAAYEQ